MPISGRRRPWRLTLVLLLALGLAPTVTSAVGTAASTTAFDYTKIAGLTKPRYDYAAEEGV